MIDKKHYRFALISDIHIDRENGGKNTYFIYAEQNLKRALEVIERRDCDFIISAGDQITNASGPDEEWRVYRSVIDGSAYAGRIYEALGNHETRSAKYGINTIGECIDSFIRFTDIPQKDVIRPDGAPYYIRVEPVFGDAFIFMAPENGVDTNLIDNFSDRQMDWLESAVERFTRENRRIFLIQHANIFGCGVGDDIGEPAYAGALRTSDERGNVFKNNQRFISLIEKHPDIILFSGHTHVDLRDDVNFSPGGSGHCNMLHIPSLAGTTRLSRGKDGERIVDRAFYEDASQGYIADVYDDRAVFTGINFYHDEIYPQYTYTIMRSRNAYEN